MPAQNQPIQEDPEKIYQRAKAEVEKPLPPETLATEIDRHEFIIQRLWNIDAPTDTTKIKQRTAALVQRAELQRAKALLTTDAPAPAVQDIALHRFDVAILRILNAAGTTLTHEKIETKQTDPQLSVSVRTIGKRLKRLRENGLTIQPGNGKDGEAITAAGRAVLAKIPSSGVQKIAG